MENKNLAIGMAIVLVTATFIGIVIYVKKNKPIADVPQKDGVISSGLSIPDSQSASKPSATITQQQADAIAVKIKEAKNYEASEKRSAPNQRPQSTILINQLNSGDYEYKEIFNNKETKIGTAVYSQSLADYHKKERAGQIVMS